VSKTLLVVHHTTFEGNGEVDEGHRVVEVVAGEDRNDGVLPCRRARRYAK
jgi:hypothetical protein